MASDKNYSFKDFTGRDLSDRKDMSNINIEASCFSNEIPETQVFPSDMKGTMFIDCNLDNVFIPPGNVLKNCSIRRFKVQNDLEDWILDAQGNPVEPVSKKQFLQLGLSIDPADIPQEKADQHPVLKAQIERFQKIDAATAEVVSLVESGKEVEVKEK